jgi:hypothetical protein
MSEKSARGDRLLLLAAKYYCVLGLVAFFLDLMSGRLRSQLRWDVPLWYGLLMAPLCGVGVALSVTATWSRPSTRLRRAGATVLVLLFSAGTFVSGVLAHAYLSERV